MLSQTRLFHALTGTELKEILIKEFTQRLDRCQILVEHLTFPKVTYKLELTIDSYPMSEAATVGATRTLGNPDHVGTPNREELVYERTIGDTQETAPDKIREENDLPVFRTERQQDTGTLIDAPQKGQRVSATVGEGTKPRAAKAKQTLAVEGEKEVFVYDPIEAVPL